MARKERNDVDYFPHSVTNGKKMFIIEAKYKNDGYAVWYKLLEELGKAQYHYININDEQTLMYLSSSFKVTEDMLMNIINDLVKLDEFDKELFELGILFNQKFNDSITDAYTKRKNTIIDKNSLLRLLQSKGILKPPKGRKKPSKGILKGDGNTQRRGEESKGEESKEDKLVIIPEFLDFLNYAKTIVPNVCPIDLERKYKAWLNNKWHDGNGKKIINWKSKLNSTIPYIAIKKINPPV